jgi:DNA mismatch endonuclease (patch repair protein)
MVDTIDAARRSANMRAITSRDTKPERKVRRVVHALGYRYRLHRKDLPGKPDLVLPKYRAIIFVHGCFWHQHTSTTCGISRLPKSRQEYWHNKLARNVERDKQNKKLLENMGWNVLTLWECETRNVKKIGMKVDQFLARCLKE